MKQLTTRRMRARSRFVSPGDEPNRPNFAALAELSHEHEDVTGKNARYPAAVQGTPADRHQQIFSAGPSPVMLVVFVGALAKTSPRLT